MLGLTSNFTFETVQPSRSNAVVSCASVVLEEMGPTRMSLSAREGRRVLGLGNGWEETGLRGWVGGRRLTVEKGLGRGVVKSEAAVGHQHRQLACDGAALRESPRNELQGTNRRPKVEEPFQHWGDI